MSGMEFARDSRFVGAACATAAAAVALQLCPRFRPTFAPPKSASTNNGQQQQEKEQNHKTVMKGVGVIGVFVAVAAGLAANAHSAVVARQAVSPEYPRVSEVSVALLSFGVLTIGRICAMPLGRWLARTLTHGNATVQQQQRFSAQLWKALFHSCATAAPLVIMHRAREAEMAATGTQTPATAWWPPGVGDPQAMFDAYPFVPQNRALNVFYLVQLGWSLHSLFVTLLQAGRGGYLTMVVHHMATLLLVSGSYFVQNNIRLGTEVFFVHDVCDVPVCVTRMLLDVGLTLPTAVAYLVLLPTWFVFRLVLFPFSVMRNVSVRAPRMGWVPWEEAHGWVPLTAGMVVLLVLHVRWFLELCHMGATFIRSGSMEDTTESTKGVEGGKPSAGTPPKTKRC